MSKGFGELTEIEFLLKATKLGLIVSQPFGDNRKYDFLVDNGKTIKRIQVKGTNTVNASGGPETYAIGVGYGSSKKVAYTSDEIDFYAVYIHPHKTWYIFPVNEINAVKISIPVFSNDSKYAKFKGAWGLLLN